MMGIILVLAALNTVRAASYTYTGPVDYPGALITYAQWH